MTTSEGSDAHQNNSAATESLARTNLLNLETSELLRESYLHVHPSGDASHVHYEARWSPSVRSYLSSVKEVIGSLGRAALDSDVAVLPNIDGGGGGSTRERGMEHLVKDGSNTGGELYRIPLLSDKFVKSLSQSSCNPITGNKSGGATSWSFPFSGGSSLTIAPIGSFAHLGNAGLANRRANGNVIPTLDVAVLVDAGDESGENEFVGGKDYLNHRYIDVSFDF